MNVIDKINIFLKVAYEIINLFRRKFKKGTYAKFAYINSNSGKKVAGDSLESLLKKRKIDFKNLSLQTTNRTSTRLSAWLHFQKMKYYLWGIKKHIENNKSYIIYGGFPMVPFAIYDGFVLNDTYSYKILDFCDGEYKLINFFPKRSFKIEQEPVTIYSREINLVIDTSYEITDEKILNSNLQTFRYGNNLRTSNINSEILIDIYAYVKNVLDNCQKLNVSIVHLYVASRVPIAFVVGVAIQHRHPPMRIYNFENNEYRYFIDLSKNKIRKIKE